MSWFLIKLAIRIVVFGGVFGVVAWKHEKVKVEPRWALPLVGLVFALLNTGLYWAMKPILNLATLGSMALVMPLVLNGLFLWATNRVLKPLKIEGLLTMFWLSLYLTLAHGALWLVLDKIL